MFFFFFYPLVFQQFPIKHRDHPPFHPVYEDNACVTGRKATKSEVGFSHLLMLNWISINKKIKNIKNVKRCRDGMPKSMKTR